MSLAPQADPDLRRGLLSDLLTAYERVSVSGRGEVIFCAGQAGSGRTTLLAQLAGEVSADRRRPEVIAGGFGYIGTYRGLWAWRLPSRRLELLGKAARTASGLGHLIATAAASAAVGASGDNAQLFTSVAALVGQAAQASGFAADQAAAKGEGVVPPPSAISASALLHAVRSMIQSGRPVVLILDDLDTAQPPAEWCTVFIERWVAPLLREAPLLVIASILEDDNSADRAAVSASADGLTQLLTRSGPLGAGWARTVRVRPLSGEDITSWLDPVDPVVVDDLMACAGGHPGWTVGLFREWIRRGLIAQSTGDGSWRYRSDDLRAAAETAEGYVQTLLWELVDGDVETYDRADRILRLAAIEGTSFTADVIAKVLGEDRDELIDWIDEWLVSEDADQSVAPLTEMGFASLPSGMGETRHLALYAFRSSLLCAALYPISSPSDSCTRDAIGQYAQALAETYGRRGGAPLNLIARLYRLAGDERAEVYYRYLGHLTADRSVHAEILNATVGGLVEARSQNEKWAPTRSLDAATQVILSCVGLRESLQANAAINYLMLGREVAEEVEQVASDIDTKILQAHALSAIGRHAYREEWFADSLACASAAQELWASFPDHAEVASAVVSRIGSYARLLSLLRGGATESLAHSLRRQLPVPVPGVLPAEPFESWGGDEDVVVAAMFSDEARALVEVANDELPRVPREQRGHAQGELFLASAELASAEDDLPATAALLRSAAEQFGTCEYGALCPRKGEATARLTQVLWLEGNLQSALESGEMAVHILASHGYWDRVAQVQRDLANAYKANGNRPASLSALAHGIYFCRMSGSPGRESSLWAHLALWIADEGHDESLALECEAMAAVLSVDSGRHYATETGSDVQMRLESDQQELARQLEEARIRWDSDRGVELLERGTGTSEDQTATYLAGLVERAGNDRASV